MNFRALQNGHRIASGDTPHGKYRVEWDAQGNLVSHEIEIKEPPSQGLGDTVAKMTKAVGLKGCGGCKKRQQKLNQMFPYGKGE